MGRKIDFPSGFFRYRRDRSRAVRVDFATTAVSFAYRSIKFPLVDVCIQCVQRTIHTA